MENILSTNTDLLWAAVVSAVVSAAVSYFFRRRETRHRLQTEYEYEQRKKLRELIGRYHGRLLQAANSLNYRFWNLYGNADEGWLDVDGDVRNGGYYFTSFVHRFLAVAVRIRQFENESIVVDARIAEKKDFTFLSYVAALQWVLTDVSLFRGLDYDTNRQKDHFFSDNFRLYCDACLIDGQFPSYQAFCERTKTDRSLDPVLSFFADLQRSEDRLRWDRLVAFHLLLMAFINAFGYDTQYTSSTKFRQVAKNFRHGRVFDNLIEWLPRHGLDSDAQARLIIRTRDGSGEGFAARLRGLTPIRPPLSRAPSSTTRGWGGPV